MRGLWVADLQISSRTADKIQGQHGITPHEVRDAIVCVRGLQYVWKEHPERGLRAIVHTKIRGREALLVIYPRDDRLGDSYSLGSAYFVDV
ncbi:MAG: hypothetical protein M3P83_02570 [Actinomycetota bacterium]|nr:hypothetical protein [Actinomycetota bacterium]